MACKKKRDTPFCEILSQLAFGLKLGRWEGGDGTVIWESDEILTYLGERIKISRLKRLVRGLIKTARLLLNDLLLDPSGKALDDVDLDSLKDDLNKREQGHNFIHDQRNKHILGGAERITRRLQRYDVLKKSDTIDELLNDPQMKGYILKLEVFIEHLLLLIYLTGGQPPRGTDLSLIQYVNSSYRRRNAFVTGGRAMITNGSRKSCAATGYDSIVARFLPFDVGQMLVAFLTEVHPFLDLLRKLDPSIIKKDNGFLFANPLTGYVMDTPRLTWLLKKQTLKYLGREYGVADMRQIAIAIGRKFYPGPALSEDQKAKVNHVFDLQSSHSTPTGVKEYAVPVGCDSTLNAEIVDMYFQISMGCHSFWGLPSRKPSAENDDPYNTSGL